MKKNFLFIMTLGLLNACQVAQLGLKNRTQSNQKTPSMLLSEPRPTTVNNNLNPQHEPKQNPENIGLTQPIKPSKRTQSNQNLRKRTSNKLKKKRRNQRRKDQSKEGFYLISEKTQRSIFSCLKQYKGWICGAIIGGIITYCFLASPSDTTNLIQNEPIVINQPKTQKCEYIPLSDFYCEHLGYSTPCKKQIEDNFDRQMNGEYYANNYITVFEECPDSNIRRLMAIDLIEDE